MAALCLASAASAQPFSDTVTWTVAPQTGGAVKPGGRTTVTLRGAVAPGWHVYGLKQLPSGPTPLRVAVDGTAVIKAAGPATGSAPVKQHDPAFNLETQYYDKAFTLTVPVKVGATPGAQSAPISVRFQTCNGEICQPPRTVRLTAPITVSAAR